MSQDSIFTRALSQIDRGRQGLNGGIPIHFERLSEYIPNIQQKTYYLIGAGTKVGKTSLADDLFFYNSLDYYFNLKYASQLNGFEIDIDYFSYEIDSETKILKGINRKLWHNYGIITDSNTILSRGKNRCSDEIYDLVLRCKDYFDEIQTVVTVHDMPDNPTGIRNYLYKKAEKHGQIIRKNINKDPNGTPIMRFDKYVPNNPNRYWLIFIDHIALMAEERGFTTKQNIDKMSQYLVNIRNNLGAIPIVIQQLAFDSENDERFKSNRLTPTLRDFGDSKYTTRDANIIMALFSPYRYELENFQGYDITRLGNSFRNLEIIENRDGEPNINIGLNFIGPCGTFREFPKAKDMKPEHYEYGAKYINSKPNFIKNDKGIWMTRV